MRGRDVPSEGCQPPGPGPALPAARLLDEPVLRQLAKVERAGGRRLADPLAQFGGGHRAAEGQLLVQRDPYRMREGAQRPRVSELPRLGPFFARHISTVNSRNIPVNSFLSKAISR